MKAIGIDIGTTTVSGVVLDTEQNKVAESRTVQNGSFIRTANEWERIQDVSVVWQKGREMLDELLTLHKDVSAIGLTGQMHGIVYTDQDGMCVSPLYTWQDGRGSLPLQEGMSAAAYAERQCGIRVPAGYGLLTHFYNCRNSLTPQDAVSLCTVGDYMGMRLTGRKRPLVHSSNAASMGFYDVRSGSFQETALRKLGVETALLPEVTDDFSVLGTYRGIPVTAALGDNQASFLGSAGLEDNTVLLNVGTGGQISVLSDRYFEAPDIEARPFVKGRYLLAGSSLCGGRAYAILERFFRSCARAMGAADEPQYTRMEKLARQGMASSDPMEICTAFNGTRSDPQRRGSITGITEDNFTPEGLAYGVLKGMAQELYSMYDVIHRGTGVRAERLMASGNGVRRNDVLQEIFSHMFGTQLILSPYEEEAACGAALSSLEYGKEK